MLINHASPPFQRRTARSAEKLLTSVDMWDSPEENAVCLDGPSEILRAYRLINGLTEMIHDGREIKIAVERQSANGGKRIRRGRDYDFVIKCLKINPLMAERYDLPPDMDAWLELLRDPRISALVDTLQGWHALKKEVADILIECVARFRRIITSKAHRKRCYNEVGNARRRRHSMIKAIRLCYCLCDEVEIDLINLSWKPGIRMRMTLSDTDAAYKKLANRIRHNSVSHCLLAAIFSVELSDHKGFHISGMLLLKPGAGDQAANLGRYWRDNVTDGEGSFLCATDKPFATILSKWSGLNLSEVASPVDVQGDHARQQLLEAAVTRFADLSQKLRANGNGKKHRQIRIFKGKQIRNLAKIMPSVVDSGGEKW